jgi:hypothetical protein
VAGKPSWKRDGTAVHALSVATASGTDSSERDGLMAIGHAIHDPPLRPALVAQEIENAVGGDRGIDDESAEIAHHPGLAEIAEEEIGLIGISRRITAVHLNQ